MDYAKIISAAARDMRPSGIRKFFDIAAEMKDCISLGVGEPDFKTPWTVRDADIEAMRSEYDMRRRFLVSSLNRMGLDCFEPEGAFYAFPSIRKTGLSSEDFCEKLLFGKKVAVVPGNAFGDSGEGHVRISYSYSIGHLSEALHRIELFLQELGV